MHLHCMYVIYQAEVVQTVALVVATHELPAALRHRQATMTPPRPIPETQVTILLLLRTTSRSNKFEIADGHSCFKQGFTIDLWQCIEYINSGVRVLLKNWCCCVNTMASFLRDFSSFSSERLQKIDFFIRNPFIWRLIPQLFLTETCWF